MEVTTVYLYVIGWSYSKEQIIEDAGEGDNCRTKSFTRWKECMASRTLEERLPWWEQGQSPSHQGREGDEREQSRMETQRKAENRFRYNSWSGEDPEVIFLLFPFSQWDERARSFIITIWTRLQIFRALHWFYPALIQFHPMSMWFLQLLTKCEASYHCMDSPIVFFCLFVCLFLL